MVILLIMNVVNVCMRLHNIDNHFAFKTIVFIFIMYMLKTAYVVAVLKMSYSCINANKRCMGYHISNYCLSTIRISKGVL